MARRSSARLRDKAASTPKRVSLSHDARPPQTLPARLTTLREADEIPGAFPSSVSPPMRAQRATESARPQTPPTAPQIKAADEEMHPGHHQQSTAKPLDEARHLGFANMAPHTAPPRHTSKLAALQGTPTKSRHLGTDMKTPSFQFTFRREHSLELSPAAKQLMLEKREEAAKIREQMIADGEGADMGDEKGGRKLAVPKSKKGRFSQTHVEQFAKMDSIAGHASAFRADPGRQTVATTPSQLKTVGSAKSLKRSPSKAGLDVEDGKSTPRSATTSASILRNAHVPRAMIASTSAEEGGGVETSSSSAKRIKLNDTKDVSSMAPVPMLEAPSTPQHKSFKDRTSKASLAHLTTPTQSSLARVASIKSTATSKIPAPALLPSKPDAMNIKTQAVHKTEHSSAVAVTSTPSKTNATPARTLTTNAEASKSSTPLLARSPSKAALFPQPNVGLPSTMMGALLTRSPSRPAALKANLEVVKSANEEAQKPCATPLLARSPIKSGTVMANETQMAKDTKSAVPFLARSPTKIKLADSDKSANGAQASDKTESKLLDRFQLLRKSPMKSILRSPQRLYSDDPAKIAAGTHLATPPARASGLQRAQPSATPTMAAIASPGQKHVDFTSSTKARDLQPRDATSRTPSKSPTPPVKFGREIAMSPEQNTVNYPELPSIGTLSPSPQKRRQTAAPGDFTFRAGDGIIFSQSPNAPPSAAVANRPSTIRHVSHDTALPPPPPTGSKKRKFDFENETASLAAAGHDEAGQDKENIPAPLEEDPRPAKRARINDDPQVSPTKPAPNPGDLRASPTKMAASRPPTLGVKPKTAIKSPQKRSAIISQARLAALAQPKRRG